MPWWKGNERQNIGQDGHEKRNNAIHNRYERHDKTRSIWQGK